MTRVFKAWFGGFVATVAFFVISYQWFDRLIALWI
jgi:membrane-associated phospholipid phosphatase